MQGIDGLGLKADLEIDRDPDERAGISGHGDLLVGPDEIAGLDQKLGAVSVKRVVAVAVVDDDEVAVAWQAVGEGDAPALDGPDGQVAGRRGDIDPVVHGQGVELGVALEAVALQELAPGVGPGQPAFELAQGGQQAVGDGLRIERRQDPARCGSRSF